MFNGLSKSDKALTDALWMLTDDLYTLSTNSHKMRNEKVANNFKRWQSHVKKVQRKLRQSGNAGGNRNSSVILEIAPRIPVDATQTEFVSSPLPSSLTPAQRAESFEKLRNKFPQLTLADLLLPTTPVQPFNAEHASLTDTITNLAFQLK